MKTKIIPSILISSLLIQITLTSGGCMTFKPVDNNNPANLKNEKHTLLFKLKNKGETRVDPKNLIYYGNDSSLIYGKGDLYNNSTSAYRSPTRFEGIVQPLKIDSEQVIGPNHFFWMNDKSEIIINKGELRKFTSNNGNYYWVVQLHNMDFMQIFENNIEGVEIEKPSWAGYALLILVLVGSFIAVANSHSNAVHESPLW
jgi:hypothetical protein